MMGKIGYNLNIERKTQRKIPETIGKAVAETLEKIDWKYQNCSEIMRLRAIDLCYREKRTDEAIAEILDSDSRKIAHWINDIVKENTNENDAEWQENIVRIIKGRAKGCFDFKCVYEESNRGKYATLKHEDPKMIRQLKQGRKEFRSMMLRAGINLECFTGREDRLQFNEAGKALAIDVLNNRTKRKRRKNTGNSTGYEVYHMIRLGRFPHQHYQYYKWMLDAACSNLQDLKDAYPDRDYPEECDVKHEFWRNTCERNNGLGAFPGIACLGILPWQISDGWYFILDEIIYLDPLIVDEFSGRQRWSSKECEMRKERWITFLMGVLTCRLVEHEKIMTELTQNPTESVKEFHWLLDYLLGYENKFEDEGITRTTEEKWASRQIKEDKRLKANWSDLKESLAGNSVGTGTHDAKKAARILCEWGRRSRHMTRRLSTEEIVECVNLLLYPE